MKFFSSGLSAAISAYFQYNLAGIGCIYIRRQKIESR